MFVVVTGDHLILGTRRFAIYGLILTCVTSPVMFLLHFQPPYLQYWQIPCYVFSYLVTGVTLCTFGTMFRSLFRAATLLNNCFKVRNSKNVMYEATLQHSARFSYIIFRAFFLHISSEIISFNPSQDELNPFCHLLELLEALHIFHVSSVMVNFVFSSHNLLSTAQN